jgi:beta-mannosidase
VFSSNLLNYLNNAGCERNAEKSCFLHFSLFSENGDNISPDNFLFPGPLKELTDFEVATITVKSVTPGKEANTFEITIETNRVALFVWLEVNDVPGEFSDNGFLLVTRTRKVEFNAKKEVTSEQLKNNITIVSLADTY